jgi:hypothetical protein
MGELYSAICGSDHVSTSACTKALSVQQAKGHTPSALHFLGVSVNETAHGAQTLGGLGSAFPYYVLIALVAATGWYQVRQTQARQLQSGNAPPNAQMQAMTKIFPVFFAFICFGLNAGATLYFVVSNAWRIGQQHLVIGKLYDQGLAAGQIKAAAPDDDPDPNPKDANPKDANGKALPPDNGKAKPGGGTKGSGAKGSGAKPSGSSNGNANGNAKNQGMSPGARRKKRKR